MHNISLLRKKKNSDYAIFLGCGPSISDITEDQWKKIQSMDIWTSIGIDGGP